MVDGFGYPDCRGDNPILMAMDDGSRFREVPASLLFLLHFAEHAKPGPGSGL